VSNSRSKNDNYKADQNNGTADEIFKFVEKSTLENQLLKVSANQSEHMVDLTGLELNQAADALLCPKCGANKLAKSRPKGLDGLITRFVARRPYRCLHCYHRFWQHEKFSADSRRIWSWGLLLLLFILLVLTKSQLIQQAFLYTDGVADRPALSGAPPSQTNNVLGGQHATVSKEGGRTAQFSKDDSQNEQANLNRDRQGLDGYSFQGPGPQQLSAGELELRLEQAKLKEKRVEQANQLKQAELVSQLATLPAETESLLHLDINYRVEQWRKAWQQGDSDGYLDVYSSEFKPDSGLSRNDWREQRYQRVVPESSIKLKLSGFKVAFSEQYQRATVEFNQRYQSKSSVNLSRKELVLIKLSDQWSIVSERVMGR
jgi:DNA-directed RNA polymerase subunit RPC12/RpoP